MIKKGGESVSKEIRVNQAAIEANVEAISGAASYFDEAALTPVDSKSTVTANTRGQEAYAKFQKVKNKFGNAIKQEVNNIRSLGVTFQEYDEMLSELWEKGFGKNREK